jgi:hypothetical protein
MLDPRGLRFLARSFAAGAVYDVAVALIILAAPAALFSWLAIPPPPEPMHFRFAALLLLTLPMFYVLPASDPARYAPVASAGVGARLLGTVFLTAHVVAGAPAAYAAFAAADLAFAALHLIGLHWAGFDVRGRPRGQM